MPRRPVFVRSARAQLAGLKVDVDLARLGAVGERVFFQWTRLGSPHARRVGEPRPQPRHLCSQRVDRVLLCGFRLVVAVEAPRALTGVRQA
jgi:hypothetical protein